MLHHSRTNRRAFSLGLAGTFIAASTAAARQGVSPFGDATPVSTAETTDSAQGWKVGGAVALDLAGTPCALSPDGQWLAGTGPDRELSLWSVPGLEQTLVTFHEAIDIDSIAWAPDSTAIAFSIEAFVRGIDGDIFVYELGEESVRNLTDDGFEGGFISGDAPASFPIDVMPAWTPDSSAIVFARSTWDDAAESIPTDIARIPRGGGEVEVLISIPARPFSIFTPMEVLPDGSIVYAFGFSDVDDELNGLWKLDPNGNTALLVPGAAAESFPIPIILDVWSGDSEFRVAGLSGYLVNAMDYSKPWLFTWSSETGGPEPVASFDMTEPIRPITAFWSPDGGTLLAIGRRLDDGVITVETTGPVSDLATLPEASVATSRGPRWIRPTWSANDTVLIPSIAGIPYLLTMEPVGTA